MSIYQSANHPPRIVETYLEFPEGIDIGQLLVKLSFTSLQTLVLVCRSILSFLNLLLDRPQITLTSFQISPNDCQLLLDLLEFLRVTVNSLSQLLNIMLGFRLSDFCLGNSVIGEVE